MRAVVTVLYVADWGDAAVVKVVLFVASGGGGSQARPMGGGRVLSPHSSPIPVPLASLSLRVGESDWTPH